MLSIEDAIMQMNVLFNLYNTQGIARFIAYDFLVRDVELPIIADSVNTQDLRIFYEEIYSQNRSFFINSSLNNKRLGFVAINYKELINNKAIYEVVTVLGSEDLMSADDPICGSVFPPDLCIKTGWGDLEQEEFSGLYFGGYCEGGSEGEISAHEAVQQMLTKSIPLTATSGNKFKLNYFNVKYTNVMCVELYAPLTTTFLQSSQNWPLVGCENIYLTDAINPHTTEYVTEMLDCAYCAMELIINEFRIGQKVLSSINISNNCTSGLTYCVWQAKICYGDTILVPIEIETSGPPQPIQHSDQIRVTGSNPFELFNLPVESQFN